MENENITHTDPVTQTSGSSWIVIALAVLAIVIGTALSFDAFRDQFVRINAPNTASLERVDSCRYALFEQHVNPGISTEEKEILRQKIQVLREQKIQYMYLLTLLYKNYYALVSLFPFLSGLTGVAIFIILQNGWKSSQPLIKAIFISLALLSAAAGIFPQVYQQEENISRYTQLHVALSRLQKDIFNYNLTGPYIGNDSLSFRDFTLQVNEEEKRLIDLHLGLEQREITQDIFDMSN